MRTEQAKQPIHLDRYCFKLRSLPLELVTYVSALKETLHYSPWFKTIMLRSLIEPDDRIRTLKMREFYLKSDEIENSNFLLLILFKENYRLLLSDRELKTINLRQDESGDKLLMFPTGVPSTLASQWSLLNNLAGEANARR